MIVEEIISWSFPFKVLIPPKGCSTMFTYHQPVTFPGCSVLRTSLSVAVLCRSAASLPSSPTPAVTFTHLPNTHGGINGPETSNNLALTSRFYSSVLRFFPSSPENTEEFHGRTRDVVPPACPESVSGSPPDGHTSTNTSPGRQGFLLLTYLPFSVLGLVWSGLVLIRSVTLWAILSVNHWTWSDSLACTVAAAAFSPAWSTVATGEQSKTVHIAWEMLYIRIQTSPPDLTPEGTSSEPCPFCSWSVFCFKGGFWKAFIQSRASPVFSAERWSLNQRTMSVRPRLVWTSSWLYSSGDGHWVRQNICQDESPLNILNLLFKK